MEQYRITKYRESKSKSFYENKSKNNINQSNLVWTIQRKDSLKKLIFYSF